MRRLLILLAVLVSACGGKDSPTAPSTPTPSVTRIIELGGSLNFGTIQVGSEQAQNFSIANRGNANLTITGLTGPCGSAFTTNYTTGTLAPNQVQIVTITFRPTVQGSCNGTLTVAGDQTGGVNTLPVTATGARPAFTRSGVGDSVFDMPIDVARVRIVGTYTGHGSNFIVKVGTRLLVNEIIGTGWPSTRYDGVVLTGGGGTVSITNSSGVQWTFVEQ